MLPDDAQRPTPSIRSVQAARCHHNAGRTGHFPAPPCLSGPAQHKLHRAPQPRILCSFSGNKALNRATEHIRRTHRRQHWRLAQRLSPTITDMMIINWCKPEALNLPVPLHQADIQTLRQFMITLVTVRQRFLVAYNNHSALMVDAGLVRLAAMLRAAKTI